MEQIEINTSEILSQAWELTKKYGISFAFVILAVAIVEGGLNALGLPHEFWDALAAHDYKAMAHYNDTPFYYSCLYYLITIAIGLGITRMFLLVAKGENHGPSLDAYKVGAMVYLKYFAINIIVGIIIIVGLIACIIPGIIFGARLNWAGYYFLEHPEATITEAIGASWNMSNYNVLNLIFLALVAGLIAISGLIFCGIGVFYTSVIATFAETVTYLTLKKNL